MNFTNYHIIASFLSSSELNRCKKNGLKWFEHHSIKEWNDIFKTEWLPRKLRRKLRHLYHCNILPVKIAAWVTPVMTTDEKNYFDEIGREWARLALIAEDEAILGINTNEKGLSHL